MKSEFYGYYFVSTDYLLNKWGTNEVEKFILAYGDFVQKGYGEFSHKSLFCTIQLMNIKSYDSWSSNDFDKIETNYISIVTSPKTPTVIKEFFEKFEIFLGCNILEEDETM